MKWWRLRPYRMNLITWLGKFLTSIFGAPETNRTPDLLSTKQLLYQLSYKGIYLITAQRESSLRCGMVRLEGLEPSRTRRQILSLLRLPITPQSHSTCYYCSIILSTLSRSSTIFSKYSLIPRATAQTVSISTLSVVLTSKLSSYRLIKI